MISNIIEYVKVCFRKTKQDHPNVRDVILKSALVYQYLYLNNFDERISIDKILELNDNEIGLIGPGNGCLTWILERIFHQSDILHSHSILHDAFGRFYVHHSKDRGYTCLTQKQNTKLGKKISIMRSDIRINILCLQKNHNIKKYINQYI